MGKFSDDTKELLVAVGGKENIKAVTHCVTRMRFVLLDVSKADTNAIENLKCVKGTFTQAGQFQVIIGNEVSDFYQEFIKLAGIDGISKEALKSEAKNKQALLQQVMTNLAEIFSPIISALICGGLILGTRSVIGDIELIDGHTLVEHSQFFAGLYSFLWLIGEAIFHFLPVGIVWSITKKMGTSQILGIVLGLTLVSPQLLNAYAVGNGEIPPVWDFGFLQIQMIGYQAQVIPAILSGFVLVYLEKFWRKVSPEFISMIVVPLFSLIPAVVIAHAILGPIGWSIGNLIAHYVFTGLTSSMGWLFAGLFGFFYAPLVITGLHHMTNAIDLQLMSQYTGTILWPMVALSNIAQGSAVLGMFYLQRKDSKAKQLNVPSFISCYLGVTEPALFGVNLKYGFPFFCALVGSSMAAMLSVYNNVMSSSIGVGGIPGILSIKPQYMLSFALSMMIAILVPFILTVIVGKKKLVKKENNHKENTDINTENINVDNFIAPIDGEYIELEKVPDKTFSQKLMGDGFAILPSGNTLISPVYGTVSVVFPSGHAYGIVGDDGREWLIHLGIDTVELGNKFFKSQVEVGAKVKPGTILAILNWEEINKHDKSMITPIICTNGKEINLLKVDKNIKQGDVLI